MGYLGDVGTSPGQSEWAPKRSSKFRCLPVGTVPKVPYVGWAGKQKEKVAARPPAHELRVFKVEVHGCSCSEVGPRFHPRLALDPPLALSPIGELY